MTSLTDIRQKFPQYNDLSDDDLARAIHEKFYADMPREEFDAKIGHKPNWISGVMRRASDAGQQAREMVHGKVDPAFADLPTYAPTDPEKLIGQQQAKSVTFTDKGYADILAQQLGDRFLGIEHDANQYPILKYVGDDGQPARAYVNQPGLDWQDIDRGVMAALPYLATQGPLGRLLKGAGVVPRVLAQAPTAAATSVAQDVTAQSMGSTEGIDLTRAGFAAGGATIAEVAAPLASAAKRWWQGGRQYLDETGNLTRDAARLAREAGIDVDNLDSEMAKAFADGLNVGRDPKEIASWIQTNRFGIPTTKAQRTKDPQLSIIEKDIRMGNLGQGPKQTLDAFYKEQEKALQRSAFNRTVRDPDAPVDPYRDGVGAMVAPTRQDFGPGGVQPGAIGRDIQSALKGAREKADEVVNEAYKGVTDLVPAPAAFAELPDKLRDRLGTMRINAQTPTATAMVEDLMGFAKGKRRQSEAADFIGQVPSATIHDQQKALLGMYRGAVDRSDKAAAKAVYDGFNDWIDAVAAAGLIKGDTAEAIASAANLRTARQITREVRGLFDPRGAGVDPAAAKILKDIVDLDNNADGIIATLFGGGGAHTVPKKGSIDALRHIDRILKDRRLIDAETAARTWNDIRMAHWSRLVADNKGGMNSPTVAANNIQSALRNQMGVMKTLYTPDEIKVFHDYAKALREAAFKDPNPSGTASSLRALMKNDGSWIKTLLQTQSKRELFSKHNVVMSRIYQILAQNVPIDILGSKNAAAMAATRRAVDQRLTPRPPMVLAPYGGAVGAGMAGEDE